MKKKIDYRSTFYSPFPSNIRELKKKFVEDIRKNHPKVIKLYPWLRRTANRYNENFKKIYQVKCCFCGVDITVMGITNFELDHFISRDQDSNLENDINNIVISCRDCNRSKGTYVIKQNIDLLHPDSGVSEAFIRTNDYYIVVSDGYVNDTEINGFYTKLNLSSEIKRIDYLIMELKSFVNKFYSENSELEGIYKLITSLLDYRNTLR